MLTVNARLKRVGREMRMLVENADGQTSPDPALLRVIARAHDFQERLAQDVGAEAVPARLVEPQELRGRWAWPDAAWAWQAASAPLESGLSALSGPPRGEPWERSAQRAAQQEVPALSSPPVAAEREHAAPPV